MVKGTTDGQWAKRMVKDTIDRDPNHVFHHPYAQSILLWLFQSQDDPEIPKLSKKSKERTTNTKKIPAFPNLATHVSRLKHAAAGTCGRS